MKLWDWNQTRSTASELEQRTSMEHLMLWRLMNTLQPSSHSQFRMPQVNQRQWLKAPQLSTYSGIAHILMEEVKSKDTRLNTGKHLKPHGFLLMDQSSSLRHILYQDLLLATLMSSKSRQLMLLETQDHPCHLAHLSSRLRLILLVHQEHLMPPRLERSLLTLNGHFQSLMVVQRLLVI